MHKNGIAQPEGKPFPSHRTEEEAERFVAEADLSEYDFSEFQPATFEFRPRIRP